MARAGAPSPSPEGGGSAPDSPGPRPSAAGLPGGPPDATSARAGPWLTLLGALLGLLGAVGAVADEVPGSLDDAFVVLVHARNLAGGAGFAHEPGGPPVDGFTSVLDVLQKAWVVGLGGEGAGNAASGAETVDAGDGFDALAASAWLGLAWLSLAGALGGALAVRMGGRAALAVAFAVGAAPGLAEGTAYRLETPLFGALWVLVLAATRARRAGPFAALGLLLAIARPEGLVLAPAAWCARALLLRARERSGATPAGEIRRRRAEARVEGLLLAIALLAWIAWRVHTFGHAFPNSYHAKASDRRWHELADGARYAAAFLATWPGFALALAVLGAALGTRRGALARAEPIALAALGLFAFALTVAAGGDSYVGARLFTPATLALWLAVAASMRGQAKPLSLALALLALASASDALRPLVASPRETAARMLAGPPGEEVFAPDAVWLAAAARALDAVPDGAGGSEVIAHRHAQRFPWYAPGLGWLDLTGLTDTEIAHLPAPGPIGFGRDAIDVALAREVALIHLDHQAWRPDAWWDEPFVAALSRADVAPRYLGEPLPSEALAKRLAERYVLASRLDAYGPGRHVNLLARSDLAAALEREGFAVGRPAPR